MRNLAALLVAVIVAGLGAVVPAAAPTVAAAGSPKVAIIVGPTHGTTDRYRSYADQFYAEAIRWTPNVVRVYSPTATWARVAAAVAGASIVVYLGHGNGWPSPYTYDPAYTTKNGFGLNFDVNGDGRLTDDEVKYYGEPSIRTLTPAVNSVVLLHHLCYASGNSEPGGAEPTLSVATQRADNYAAAFLAAGAGAVMAIGHSHDPYYIREFFTSRRTVQELFLGGPDVNGNLITLASARTPGATLLLDPESPAPAGFYRAVTGRMGLTTDLVTGAEWAYTDRDPAAFAVPGRASTAVEGARVFASAEAAAGGAQAATSLPTETLVGVEAAEPLTAAAGDTILRVRLASGSTGWMLASELRPRDSRAPVVWSADLGTGAFSPNGDGVRDELPIAITLSEAASWTLLVTGRWGGPILASASGTGTVASLTWAPPAGAVDDGIYRWIVEATDGLGNGPARYDGQFVVDTVAPAFSVGGDPAAVAALSPNADAVRDTVAWPVVASEPVTISGTVRDGAGSAVGAFERPSAAGSSSLAWDGRVAGGVVLPDAAYGVELVAVDRAGNRSAAQQRAVNLYASLARVRASTSIFFPQDLDTLASRVTLAFDLARPATVTWTITTTSGAVVRTIMTNRALAAGTHTFSWDGRNDAGALVARGDYRSTVTASAGGAGATQTATVRADAFRVAVSDTTPARGQRITVTITSAEPLAANPRLAVVQPGIAAWSVATTKVATNTYRVTITLKSSAAGTLMLKAYGSDSAGRAQSTTISLPLG